VPHLGQTKATVTDAVVILLLAIVELAVS